MRPHPTYSLNPTPNSSALLVTNQLLKVSVTVCKESYTHYQENATINKNQNVNISLTAYVSEEQGALQPQTISATHEVHFNHIGKAVRLPTVLWSVCGWFLGSAVIYR